MSNAKSMRKFTQGLWKEREAANEAAVVVFQSNGTDPARILQSVDMESRSSLLHGFENKDVVVSASVVTNEGRIFDVF